MDTASHFLIGVGLGGLAHLSPEVASHSSLGLAVTIGTIIASEAPDTDYVFRIKGNDSYLKHHRGLTHSVLAWFLWPSLVTLGIVPFFHGLSWGIVWLWCFAAVLIHVALDALNTFGTQALLPFTDKRLSKDALMVLDPIIFSTQLLGIIFWWKSIFAPGPLFALIDGLTVIYIIVRVLIHQRLCNKLRLEYQPQDGNTISIIPTFRFNQWAAVVETENGFVLGKFINGHFKQQLFLKKFGYIGEVVQPAVNRTEGMGPVCAVMKQKSAVACTFFYIATHIYYEEFLIDNRIRIILTDLRFRIGNFFPFKAVFDIDHEGTIVQENLYWRGEKSSPPTIFTENMCG